MRATGIQVLWMPTQRPSSIPWKSCVTISGVTGGLIHRTASTASVEPRTNAVARPATHCSALRGTGPRLARPDGSCTRACEA